MDNNFLFRAEDDNEFIPLFSFNEQDMEGDNDMVVDDIIPILPLRNTVLFPGVVIPITVGRDKSIQAVKAAYAKDKLVGVLAQKDGNIEDGYINFAVLKFSFDSLEFLHLKSSGHRRALHSWREGFESSWLVP